MNYFVEGLQGSGKSTLVGKLSQKHPDCKAIREGEYSPIELAWCAYVSKETYDEIISRYRDIRSLIEEKTHEENGRTIICYTKIATDKPGFYQDLEQYEIYNGRREPDAFKSIVLDRYRRWNGDKTIFECSLFQNIVEDMILFRASSDEEIIDFYEEIRKALQGKAFHIYYLKTDDIASSIGVIRKERTDGEGNERWFPLMLRFFNDSPYAKKHGAFGEEGLLQHLRRRQDLELRICREVFQGQYTILRSKQYGDGDFNTI